MQIEVYEGDKVTLTAVETDKDVDFTVTNTDGKDKEEKKTAKEYEVTFAPVPAKKKNYIVSWKYKLPAGEAEISGENTYRVWPKVLTLHIKMKSGAKGKVDGFTFTLTQPDTADVTPTVPKGEYSGQLAKTSYEFTAVSPWVLESKTESDDKAAEWTLEISQTPWTAKILTQRAGTTEKAPWKQYVNITDPQGAADGSMMTVQVAPNDRALGLKDQVISMRATFPAANSKRTTPRPAPWVAGNALVSTNATAKPGVDALVYETQLALPANGGLCEFKVQLGLAGGDKCKIEVGFDDGFGDDTLYTENWRSLESEFVVPHSAIRQAWTDIVNNNDAAPAPDAKLTAAIKKILDPLFIELTFPADGCAVYTAADIQAVTATRGGSAARVFEGKTISAALDGHKCTFIAPKDLDLIRDRVLQNAVRGPRRIMLVWVDILPKMLGDDNPGVEKVSVSDYGEVFTDTTAQEFTTLPESAKLGVALLNPLSTGAGDVLGCTGLRWQLEWQPKNGGKPWSTVHASLANFKRDIAKQGRNIEIPDAQYFSQVDATPTTLPELQRWLEFVTLRKFKIKVPADDATVPGYYLGKGGEISYRAHIYVDLVHFKQGGNANAINGKIRMTPKAGLGKPQGVARTLCHEIAHNLGHAYLQNQGHLTDERGRQLKYKIPDIDFDPTIPTGNFYTGKGHAGPHCASAIKQKDASLLTAETFESAPYQIDGNCVLFGQGEQAKTVEFKFCDDCTRYIKASDAQDIGTNWRE